MSTRLKRLRSRLSGPFLMAALVLLLFCALPLRARHRPTPQFEVNANLVSLYFTVHDKNGALIPTLTKDDFTILEDKVPQTIKNFAAESDQPLTLGILLDTSTSQQKVLRLEQQSGSAFLERVLRATDEAFLISFDVHLYLLANYTNSPRALERAMNSAQIHALSSRYAFVDAPGTLLYDAVYLAAHDKLSPKTGRKALIILSDGQDQGSQVKLEGAVAYAQNANCPVYVILIADRPFYVRRRTIPYVGDTAMGELAEQTGGRVINVGNDGNKLKAAFDSIEQELRTEYVISYTPTNDKMDGSYRVLDVNVKGDGLKAQVRKGYYAVPVPTHP